MSAGVLRYTMAVRHPETGAAVALLEGEPVPDWATDLVQADDLLTATKGVDESKPAKKAAAKRSSSK